MYPISFETYQDVKSNLALATLAILVSASVFLYWLLPGEHRELLRHIPLPPWVKGIGLAAVLLAFSVFLIYGVQIHDQVYDQYIVKWRQQYDIQFILRNLCKPFSTKLDARFYDVAAENRDKFMEKLYYEYVHDRSPGIRQNTIVRFYERITNYWVLQVAQITVYFLLIAGVVYFPIYVHLRLPLSKLITMIIVLSAGLLLTDYLTRSVRISVEAATQQEIDEIHQRHLPGLEGRIKEISSEFNLKYGPARH